MRILAIDVGTGTQDILAFDSTLAITNCPKLVMPSPTAILARRIRRATGRGKALLFTGFTMGGGPSGWALKQHLDAGLKAYATPDAARTFDDDLAELKKTGVILLSSEEAMSMQGVETLELKDVDLDTIGNSLSAFGVGTQFDVIAVAVQDHGAAPPGTSDRTFRFEHLLNRLNKRPDLMALTYLSGETPDHLTRMAGVAKSLTGNRLLLMDTGFAAVVGADEDPEVSRHQNRLIVNLGNSHVIAFQLQGKSVLGMFEHHTRALDSEELDAMLQSLASGSLTNQEVFDTGGHGAVLLKSNRRRHFVAAVGPQRDQMSSSTLKPHFAVPHGDMMLAGCFGLLRACAERFPNWSIEIEGALSCLPRDAAPRDIP